MDNAMIPSVLEVEEVAPGRWVAQHPDEDPEDRDVVFSGQILAQMMMVSSAGAAGDKEIKSIHAIFSRAGQYSAGPLELLRDPMHSGRAWASDTITALQGDRLLSRGLVLLNSVEGDLMRHAPMMPDVAGPENCDPFPARVVFPHSEVRAVAPMDDAASVSVWVRSNGSCDSVVAHQAMIAWSQPGFIIGAAMRPHSETVDPAQAHRTISTGVISHTSHFHERADVGAWLLYVHEGIYAGNGRVFGRGAVFSADGTLVSTFAQDSMVRGVDGRLDRKTGM